MLKLDVQLKFKSDAQVRVFVLTSGGAVNVGLWRF